MTAKSKQVKMWGVIYQRKLKEVFFTRTDALHWMDFEGIFPLDCQIIKGTFVYEDYK